MSRCRIITADVLDGLAQLEDGSVHCCVTSPPFFGLRDYGVDGQIGLEKTPEEYVEKMVAVFREVRRVLRDDGTLWLNIGDSYATNGPRHTGRRDELPEYLNRRAEQYATGTVKSTTTPTLRTNMNCAYGCKPKDLMMMPARVAMALQADGWYLRCDIIWSKPNPMPESVTDRPTKSHEYLFLLAKSERYYYDAAAIARPSVDPIGKNRKGSFSTFGRFETLISANAHRGDKVYRSNGSSNARSVWTIATAPYPEAHFATFPPDLVKPCVLAGSPEGGTVLDPFAGSGTTGVVALQYGRSFVGVELNAGYVTLAEKRLAPVLAQELLPL